MHTNSYTGPRLIDELRVLMKNNEIDVLAINKSRMDNRIAPELG
jgi:hypothetical protein